MVPAARWLVVALLALGVAAPPVVLDLLPASGSHLDPVVLAGRAVRSTSTGWSGEVRTTGSLNVPAGGSVFGGVARLLGENNDLRAWWRDPAHWRVDRLRATGETDLVRDGRLSLSWSYEDNQVSFAPYSPIRLPNDADVLPPALAARMLAGAQPRDLSALPARRVAGRSADGLRLVPSDGRSTIARVDVWLDTRTGLPLRVDLYDSSGQRPVLTTAFISVHHGNPSARETDLQITRGVTFAHTRSLDEAAAANVYAAYQLPRTVAGLQRSGATVEQGAVGAYGRGPSALIIIPLRSSISASLAEQLRRSHGATESGNKLAVKVGPLSVLLEEWEGGHLLLVGTVQPSILVEAADDAVSSIFIRGMLP